jgi:hypothetical protein
MKVPDALIRRVCYPSSIRLPDLDIMTYPTPKPAIEKIPLALPRPAEFHPFDNSRFLRAVVPDYPGNIPNEEYRFWIGKLTQTVTTAECRWCNVVVDSLAHMRIHLRAGQCKENLLAVYKKIRHPPSPIAQPDCLCCDRPTDKLEWGVPICSTKCKNAWKFRSPEGFAYAKKMYELGEE